MSNERLHRLSAFADGASGGNPAGVWVGAALPDPDTMRRIAADVGYSETAFVAPETGSERLIRFYSPEAEVSFCGHATIATGVILGRSCGAGTYLLSTAQGDVPVEAVRREGQFEASFRSVEPRHRTAEEALIAEVLELIGWKSVELEPSIPAVLAYAGAWHLVLAVSSSKGLAQLDYDFDRLRTLMLREEFITLQLVWRERVNLFHARNPFPVGGVVEDPASGAAAAALGGYLRDAGLIDAPFRFQIRQGEAICRPSRITVDVPETGGIFVAGSAIDIRFAQMATPRSHAAHVL